MAKVLLMVPHFWDPVCVPLGISSLKAFAERNGHNVDLFDFNTVPEVFAVQRAYFAECKAQFPHFNNWNIIKNLALVVPWPYPDDGAATFVRLQLEKIATGEEIYQWVLVLRSGDGQAIGNIDFRPRADDLTDRGSHEDSLRSQDGARAGCRDRWSWRRRIDCGRCVGCGNGGRRPRRGRNQGEGGDRHGAIQRLSVVFYDRERRVGAVVNSRTVRPRESGDPGRQIAGFLLARE